MSWETENLARVFAKGFVAEYLRTDTTEVERQQAVAVLQSVLEGAYAHGFSNGKVAFGAKLIKTIGNRSTIPCNELIGLASALGDTPPVPVNSNQG